MPQHSAHHFATLLLCDHQSKIIHISIYIWGEWPHPPIATCADILTETAGVPHPHEEAYSKTNNTLCLEIQDQTQQTQHPWAYMTLIVKEHHQFLFGGVQLWNIKPSVVGSQGVTSADSISIHRYNYTETHPISPLYGGPATSTYIIELCMIYISRYQKNNGLEHVSPFI